MEGSKQSGLNDYANNLISRKARQLIGKYGFTKDDYEDLKQEMTLDLLLRLPKFDSGRASLNTFIARVVNREVADLIRHRRREMRDYRCEAWSLDEPLEGEDRVITTPGEALSQDKHNARVHRHTRTGLERTDLCLDLSLAIEDLSPKLKRLVELLLTHTITEAAQELGVHRSTLHKRIADMGQTLEDKGLREYL